MIRSLIALGVGISSALVSLGAGPLELALLAIVVAAYDILWGFLQ